MHPQDRRLVEAPAGPGWHRLLEIIERVNGPAAVEDCRERYRAAGAPFGDCDAGMSLYWERVGIEARRRTIDRLYRERLTQLDFLAEVIHELRA